jgi:hypothetical protein
LFEALLAACAEGHDVTPVAGTGAYWLSPGVPVLVAPSGIPDPVVDSAAVSPESVSEGATVALVAAAPILHEADAVAPPPSKGLFEAVFEHGIASGLNPGGVSSVTPNGMALDNDEADGAWDDVLPSGEVAPIPGIGLPCAWAATTPMNQRTAGKMLVGRIDVSRSIGWAWPPWIGASGRNALLLLTIPLGSTGSGRLRPRKAGCSGIRRSPVSIPPVSAGVSGQGGIWNAASLVRA